MGAVAGGRQGGGSAALTCEIVVLRDGRTVYGFTVNTQNVLRFMDRVA